MMMMRMNGVGSAVEEEGQDASVKYQKMQQQQQHDAVLEEGYMNGSAIASTNDNVADDDHDQHATPTDSPTDHDRRFRRRKQQAPIHGGDHENGCGDALNGSNGSSRSRGILLLQGQQQQARVRRVKRRSKRIQRSGGLGGGDLLHALYQWCTRPTTLQLRHALLLGTACLLLIFLGCQRMQQQQQQQWNHHRHRVDQWQHYKQAQQRMAQQRLDPAEAASMHVRQQEPLPRMSLHKQALQSLDQAKQAKQDKDLIPPSESSSEFTYWGALFGRSNNNNNNNNYDNDDESWRLDTADNVSTLPLEAAFVKHRYDPLDFWGRPTVKVKTILETWLQRLDNHIFLNHKGGPRWLRPYLLPPIPKRGISSSSDLDDALEAQRRAGMDQRGGRDPKSQRAAHDEWTKKFFRVERHVTAGRKRKQKKNQDPFLLYENNDYENNNRMAWQDEWEAWKKAHPGGASAARPAVDYTRNELYSYPDILWEPPSPQSSASYPPLKPLSHWMKQWPQEGDLPAAIHNRNNEDGKPVYQETLQHFNYSDPKQRHAAMLFRNAELPFKLTDVPEVQAATLKWTDEYIAQEFKRLEQMPKNPVSAAASALLRGAGDASYQVASGTAQESPNQFFAFFVPQNWNLLRMGIPPTRNNDWTYGLWSQHAQYADAVRLASDQPHYYYQAGVHAAERSIPDRSLWSFISRDLPSWSSPDDTFFVFNVEESKGIQCRFGERGVVAATHYDSGKNMVAMVTGAKRYILSPPNQCSKLGIFTSRKSPIYRHSLLNFGHLEHLRLDNNNNTTEDSTMSYEERAWLERAAQSMAIETVLKAGEVLYIPSHWFHYIISVQKSAQCNARSGVDKVGTPQFGGFTDVMECVDQE